MLWCHKGRLCIVNPQKFHRLVPLRRFELRTPWFGAEWWIWTNHEPSFLMVCNSIMLTRQKSRALPTELQEHRRHFGYEATNSSFQNDSVTTLKLETSNSQSPLRTFHTNPKILGFSNHPSTKVALVTVDRGLVLHNIVSFCTGTISKPSRFVCVGTQR